MAEDEPEDEPATDEAVAGSGDSADQESAPEPADGDSEPVSEPDPRDEEGPHDEEAPHDSVPPSDPRRSEPVEDAAGEQRPSAEASTAAAKGDGEASKRSDDRRPRMSIEAVVWIGVVAIAVTFVVRAYFEVF